MKEFIQSILNTVQYQADEKKLELSVEYDTKIGRYFLVDAQRIRQVLLNLLSNAIKFTPSGSVSIKIEKLNESRFLFSVIDTGIGISLKEQENIFAPFIQANSTTTKTYGGTGLGLSISKQLVDLMGGKIWLQSEFGFGSEFKVELDLEELAIGEEVELIEQKDLSTEMKSIRGSKILLVEDNVSNQELVLGLLRLYEFQIDLANNGVEALALFNAHDDYELILMDLQMPIMDGYETVKHIREVNTSIPIVALTANAMKDDRKKTKEAGMNEHISKPIDIENFYAILLSFIKQKHEVVPAEKSADKVISVAMKTPIQTQKRDDLFSKLQIAISTKQPRKCEAVLGEFKEYQLKDEDNEIFDKIKLLLKRYRFKEAQDLMDTV